METANGRGYAPRPMRYRPVLLLTAMCLALGVSACGGSDSGDTSDEAAAAVEQVDEMCADWREATDEARGEFPVEDFDPDSPSPQDLRAVGIYYAAGHALADELVADLAELDVPAEIQAELDALVAAFEQVVANSKAQASAAQAGDVAGFTATLDDASSSQEALQDAADELGATSCAP